jgi:hypothetical protein
MGCDVRVVDDHACFGTIRFQKLRPKEVRVGCKTAEDCEDALEA